MAETVTIRHLPLEIRQLIVGELDDVPSLANAALSHRLFRDAIQSGHLVIWNVLRNHLGDSRLLPYALACASRIENPVKLLETYRPGCPVDLSWCSKSMSLSDAGRIASFHDLVTYYGAAFFDSAFESLYSFVFPVRLQGRGRHPTPDERFRVYRALYRFELYGKLAPGVKFVAPIRAAVERLFFDPYTLWADEQLATILEFLDSRLSKGMGIPSVVIKLAQY